MGQIWALIQQENQFFLSPNPPSLSPRFFPYAFLFYCNSSFMMPPLLPPPLTPPHISSIIFLCFFAFPIFPSVVWKWRVLFSPCLWWELCVKRCLQWWIFRKIQQKIRNSLGWSNHNLIMHKRKKSLWKLCVCGSLSVISCYFIVKEHKNPKRVQRSKEIKRKNNIYIFGNALVVSRFSNYLWLTLPTEEILASKWLL